MRALPKGWYNWPRPLARVTSGKSPAPWYNTFCVVVGLWLLTEQWETFFGYLLIAESFLWTVEHAGQWNDEKVPYVPTINDVSGP